MVICYFDANDVPGKGSVGASKGSVETCELRSTTHISPEGTCPIVVSASNGSVRGRGRPRLPILLMTVQHGEFVVAFK